MGPNDDVIHEGQHSFVVGIPKDVVDHTLESRGCIAESEWHDSVFEKAILAAERRLSFVSLFDSDEVVAVLEVNFIEVFSFLNSFLELIHIRKGITVWNGDLVDCSILSA